MNIGDCGATCLIVSYRITPVLDSLNMVLDVTGLYLQNKVKVKFQNGNYDTGHYPNSSV